MPLPLMLLGEFIPPVSVPAAPWPAAMPVPGDWAPPIVDPLMPAPVPIVPPDMPVPGLMPVEPPVVWPGDIPVPVAPAAPAAPLAPAPPPAPPAWAFAVAAKPRATPAIAIVLTAVTVKVFILCPPVPIDGAISLWENNSAARSKVAAERDEEKCVAVFRPRPAPHFWIDHDDIVIEGNGLLSPREPCACGRWGSAPACAGGWPWASPPPVRRRRYRRWPVPG